MVGTAGFEPATTTPPVWCATKLRYAPMLTPIPEITADADYIPFTFKNTSVTTQKSLNYVNAKLKRIIYIYAGSFYIDLTEFKG